MITAPGGLIDAVRYSHTTGVRVEAVYDGQVLGDVPVSGGGLTLDMDSDTYASGQVDIADPAWLASGPDSALLPFGHRLRAYYTVRVGQLSDELRVGPDLLVDTVPTSAGVLSTWQMKFSSLVQQVIDARFTAPAQVAGQARVVLDALLAEAVPGAPVAHVGGDATVGATLYERERWDAVKDLASRVGCVVRPDADGFLVAPDPQPTGDPVWVIDEGVAGVLLPGSARPEVAREQRYNAVVAHNSDAPDVWAIATVTDPASPVRWDGPMGRKPYFYASTLLTTAAQAQSAADSILAGLLGRSRRVELACVPNPTLEPGDLVEVRWPGGMSETLMIRSLTLPLVPTDEGMRLVLQGGGDGA